MHNQKLKQAAQRRYSPVKGVSGTKNCGALGPAIRLRASGYAIRCYTAGSRAILALIALTVASAGQGASGWLMPTFREKETSPTASNIPAAAKRHAGAARPGSPVMARTGMPTGIRKAAYTHGIWANNSL
jgi:hypothetical protein